jgi:two-component system, response regulator PdtaR
MTTNKILIVEDEFIIALSTQKRLELQGYFVVDIASTGEEAVKAALKYKPDVILMDIKLAGQMDGIEAAKQIRKHMIVPIIYMSAYSDKKILERANSTQPFGVFLKSSFYEQLFTLISNAVKDKTKLSAHP